MEFTFQPGVYSTSSNQTLLQILESMWLNEHRLGYGDYYIISGYGNYNGGLRFYSSFKKHIQVGGRITAIFSGSATQRLTSAQVVEELLNCGVHVNIIHRKQLQHAKLYGISYDSSEELVITSGNFTGTGVSQNGEAALKVDQQNLKLMGFSWNELVNNIFRQGWDIYPLERDDVNSKKSPAWKYLYDETKPVAMTEESDQVSMVVVLNHFDTLKIQAVPGSIQGLGTQYFHLGTNAFNFFPAFTYKNKDNYPLYNCMITVTFVDMGLRKNCLVSCRADDQVEFFLSTDILRFSKIARDQDIALLTRTGLYTYDLRFIKQENSLYKDFLAYADNYNAYHQKHFGYLSNMNVRNLLRRN